MHTKNSTPFSLQNQIGLREQRQVRNAVRIKVMKLAFKPSKTIQNVREESEKYPI
jgi:hypothetical protein